jgi:carbonic anhydrase/acetyltransferase-like protein (isoleucine patch superfamily)
MKYTKDDKKPKIGKDVYVAPSADIIGEVTLGEGVSVWFNATIRGDLEPITIGKGSNIQDNCTVHVDTGSPVVVGENVTVGHQVILHGCTVGDNSLIGMGAIILNGARIGKNSIVGAGALVTEGKEFPDGSLIIGSPAKAVREVRPEEIEQIKDNGRHYMRNGREYAAGLQEEE